ncbi:conserved protein of unknown function [Candidatus Filomicrobium marinum]|uniref:HTH gntR-type domain-containing protein n=2 Tax=Filomicrobium TaxID=119044 RepID=A0A0D6JJQ7_9HYPH|nr:MULTISPECIES: GntR family transcriptional regulator [Filomicrobium]MCV0371601.1 GntR family transcriptional regulator [Filomicrobium sp.]CFX55158.1 conserved protein of unknown function [Candidatus Filomicrobium marinum]CPR22176.1 conserved protein of unknown function [Candidatus Filomicrobium marinum]SDO94013.1 GntR family transcriptional regulator [Filomicrobium insigne]
MKIRRDDPRLPATSRPYAGPLYLQIGDLLRERIRSRGWVEGQALPNEGELAREYGVSVGTMRKALEQVEAIGWICRRQGRGTFVTNPEAASAQRLNPFFDEGEHVMPQDIAVQCVSSRGATTEEAKLLILDEEESVVEIAAVRRSEGVLVIHDNIVVPERLVPGLADELAVRPEGVTTYRNDNGLVVTRLKEALTAVALPEDMAVKLGLPIGTPALLAKRVSFDADGGPIDVCVRYAVPMRTEYRIELS